MVEVNVQDILKDAGIDEPIYPGKRIVKPLKQEGEYRSHCVVFDWRDPKKFKVEVKAGLTGKDLDPKILAKYPVSFQAPTCIEFDIENKTKH